MWSKNQAMREEREEAEGIEPGHAKKLKAGVRPGDGGDRDHKGRLVARKEPSNLQAAFLRDLTLGLSISDAAKRAGYGGGVVSGSRALTGPTVRTLIARARRRRIDKDTSAALQLKSQVMRGEFDPSPAQERAIDWFLKASGLDKPEDSVDASNTKPIHQMSLGELEAMAARYQKAKQVAIVPELDGDAVQVIENKGEDTP
jgi:hypothetical protein